MQLKFSSNLNLSIADCSTQVRALNICLVHVIWAERLMSKLVLNVKYLLLLSFLTAAKFYNLGYIQGITRVHQLKKDHLVICTIFRSDFHVG